MTATPNVITGPPRSNGPEGSRVVCIGVFDGVHRGHRWLIGEARREADRLNVPLTVLTFDPHPMAVVRPAAAPQLLAGLQMRIRLLGDAGADEVRVLSFDADAAAMSAPEFVERYLRGDLSAVQVVVGTNFRFGHRAAGDVELLRELGGGGGFGVTPVGLHADGDGIWSSSRIRALVAQGDVAAAAHGLTRPHRVEGVVVHGDHRGRELGYPTANLDMPADRARPADGVYSGWLIDDPYGPQPTRWPAAISVGANTTFGGDAPRVEAYALDRDDLDLYGHVMAVDFAERLRDMRAFPGVDDLLAAMAEDVARTRLSTAGPAVGRTG